MAGTPLAWAGPLEVGEAPVSVRREIGGGWGEERERGLKFHIIWHIKCRAFLEKSFLSGYSLVVLSSKPRFYRAKLQ